MQYEQTSYIPISAVHAVHPGFVKEILIVNSATDDHDFQWIELVLFPLVENNLQSGIISRAETDALVKRIIVEAHCPAPRWADVWHKPTVRNVIDRSKITDADCAAAAAYSAKKPKAR